ncbi:MAG: hypothetical protein AAF449_04925 [Myxococcota bacterium]
MSVNVEFHASQWPDAVAAQLQSSLQSGIVPGRFLYDSPAQSTRWLQYHEEWSPARTAAEVRALYDRAFTAALDDIESIPLQYVSLGCGGGQKDAAWAKAAQARCRRVVLTDTSPSLVLLAGQAVTRAGAFDVHRMVVDLTAWPDRCAYHVEEKPTIWACLGILPNFAHDRLLPYLASLMKPEDRLVLSANLSPAPYAQASAKIVPMYDNPLAFAWYNGALVELGIARAQCRLIHEKLDDTGDIWRMRYVATLQETTKLDVHGEAVTLLNSTDLEVFQSTRYTPECLPSLLRDAGLMLRQAFVDSSREEGVYLLSRE